MRQCGLCAPSPSREAEAAAQVRDYEALIEECVRCLRPGGVLLLVEGDMVIFGEDLRPQPLADLEGAGQGGSWLARMLHGA